jgi:DNA-binding MarR family transcriptional regulator
MTTDTTPNQDMASAGLVALFRRASRLMARIFHRRDHAHHAQEHVLAILREHGSMRQGDLLEILDVRSSSLSEVLAKLQRQGLIQRNRDERDKRAFIISATSRDADAGRPDAGRESADFLFSCLDAEERRQLAALLGKLIAFLEQDPMGGDDACGFHGRARRMLPRADGDSPFHSHGPHRPWRHGHAGRCGRKEDE